MAVAADVGQALDAGLTLPASWYSDAEIHRLELERIFARTWQYAGRADAVDRSARRHRVETWGPFAFFNADPDARPLAEALGPLPDHLARGGVELDQLRFRERVVWDAQAVNWKIGIENYLECYHCPVAHPSFSRLIDVDPDAYLLESDGLLMSQFGPVRDAPGERAPYRPEGPIERAQYHFLWPNLTLNVEPGPLNLSLDVWLPAGPHELRGHTDYFFGEDVPDDKARELMAFGAEVAAEDMSLVVSVQAGLDSGAIPHGRLLVSSEHLIQHFQRLVHDAVA